MRWLTSTLLAAALLAGGPLTPATAGAQGIVVDQGRFALTLGGRSAGTEDFTIRRAGLGRDDALFANATIVLTIDGQRHEIRPLLRAIPPNGIASEYQVEVVGTDALDLRLRRTQTRYVAVLRSSAGEEQREFPAHANSRVLDLHVAHHYYFLKEVQEASVTPSLEPRSRARAQLMAGPATEEDLRLGQTVLAARRVEFSSGDDLRIVWFDRLGRVLRVEIPGHAYVAERVDLLR